MYAYPRRRALCVAQLLALAVALGGCSTTRELQSKEQFHSDTPFSARIVGPSKAVCWSVKRAMLSQGYMLDHSADSVTLTGVKEFQKDDDTNVELRMQTSCADNGDGTSTVFATAIREVAKVQNVKQAVSAGVWIATVTVPVGSEKVMQVLNRQTIEDPKFYRSFYRLVREYAAEGGREDRAGVRTDR
jgi:hypothetical protein